MTVVLSPNDVKSLLVMRDCIEIIERVFREQQAKDVLVPQRIILRMPEEQAVWLFMPVLSKSNGRIALKMISEYLQNPAKHGLPKATGLVVLVDASNGQTLCITEAVHITAMRTGAASGVATRYLAREDAHTVGIIGSGIQARTQLAAVREVRKIIEAKVYSPNPLHRREFAESMSRELGIGIRAVDSPFESVKDADIVITATNSAQPVLSGEWLKAGCHINSIGTLPDRRELDAITIARSKLVVDTMEGVLREAGDIMAAIEEGYITKEHIYAQLSEVVNGMRPGRISPSEITLFKSVGFATLDLAIVDHAYRLAVQRGIGTKADL